MESRPFSNEQIGINRLPGQGVTESKMLSGLFNDQLRANQFFDAAEQFRFIMVGERLQQGKVEAESRHGSHHNGLFCVVAQPLDPAAAQPETSISGPQHVDVATYRLQVVGLVKTPTSLTYDQVVALPAYQKERLQGRALPVQLVGLFVARCQTRAQLGRFGAQLIIREAFERRLELIDIFDLFA